MKIIYLVPFLYLLIISCGSNTQLDSTSNDTARVDNDDTILDTISSWSGLNSDSAVFKAPNGQYYMVYADYEEEIVDINVSLEVISKSINVGNSTSENKACDNAIFDGKDRKVAKISVSSGKMESFGDLDELLSTLLDDEIISNKITSSGENSNRVKEEKRNVRIELVWLYTFKVQSDEDYHLIIGSTDDVTTANFFNIEISGLPEEGSTHYNALYAARKMFFDFFGEEMGACFAKSYSKSLMYKPIPIEVEGSLFFDKLHYEARGPIGPAWARGDTYWEIHPVTSIKFL